MPRDAFPGYDESVNIDAEPENTLGGRVNTDMEFEDAVKLMLNTDLRESGEEAEVTGP